MLYIIVFIVVILIIGPGIWVNITIKKHSKEIPDLPGTGAEFATHLIQRFELGDVKVERCDPNQDHYSPQERVIRLSPAIYDGRSISAVTIAAHETGHAIQYHFKEPITKLREKYTPLAMMIEKASLAFIGLSPILIAIFKLPHIGFISIGAGLIALLISVLLQLVILPMEWDASFNKAMPIITQGQYLDESQLPAAKKILRAAALTYVAATLSSLLRIGRWLAIFKGFR